MSDLNSIRWRIKLRTRRKKNRVKRTNNEEVMTVSVKRGRAGNLQHSNTNILFVLGRRAARRCVCLAKNVRLLRFVSGTRLNAF
ncbi:hypothetical protein HanRHA438_Chr14g0648451 [Helianthus annuus]|uniref:Uncharacterized protein n=1 Tax=Helianthus annuus TaxID=4232 RepID=A0A9K3E7V3_HELAN|nr:hypothetical protein HanXRQr2_Chr14g0637941 [Helianthus annuus]KAJ0468067.1 hypothetical protein HanIR_Chr14g0692331 [Helianthus annuus]KAJ0839867.1 hypothetical protein HanPSC8_Chr14g0611881 [Helianthus annuus]KAJ0853203.1 hypothetical protein HanRHA438_Chr14g0648451 [Helianthus annuus]